MSIKGETVEERKAEVLIKLRKYKLLEKEKFEGAFGYTIDIPEDKEKAIIWCILDQATVGIVAMNQLYKVMKEKELERAIVITEGRYTHAVKQGAKKKKVELTPQIIPSIRHFRTRTSSEARNPITKRTRSSFWNNIKSNPTRCLK